MVNGGVEGMPLEAGQSGEAVEIYARAEDVRLASCEVCREGIIRVSPAVIERVTGFDRHYDVIVAVGAKRLRLRDIEGASKRREGEHVTLVMDAQDVRMYDSAGALRWPQVQASDESGKGDEARRTVESEIAERGVSESEVEPQHQATGGDR
jgi:hypothetical protein